MPPGLSRKSWRVAQEFWPVGSMFATKKMEPSSADTTGLSVGRGLPAPVRCQNWPVSKSYENHSTSCAGFVPSGSIEDWKLAMLPLDESAKPQALEVTLVVVSCW